MTLWRYRVFFLRHSHIIVTLQMVNWEAILIVTVHGRIGGSDKKHFLSEFPGSTWGGGHRIHIDSGISTKNSSLEWSFFRSAAKKHVLQKTKNINCKHIQNDVIAYKRCCLILVNHVVQCHVSDQSNTVCNVGWWYNQSAQATWCLSIIACINISNVNAYLCVLSLSGIQI